METTFPPSVGPIDGDSENSDGADVMETTMEVRVRSDPEREREMT
jgi:hypothetical protein